MFLEASVNAKEEGRVPCCFFFSHGPEAKPQEADPYEIYQQFEIHQRKPSSRRYFATSVDPDGVPPEFLKRKYWTVEYSTTSGDYGLKDDAKGIDTKRYDLPTILNTNIPVGHWYVPFIFVKEGDAKDHLKISNYYRMTLYQRWEEVYSCENAHKDNCEVVVNVQVEPQVVKLEGQEIKEKRGSMDETEFVWFEGGVDKKLGLRYAVIERMKYEELRFGWNSDPETAVIETSVRFNGGDSSWKSYKGYVLVESFVLRRMDKSLVVTFEFRHDKLKSKWRFEGGSSASLCCHLCNLRRLSECQRSLSKALPEGPSSGVLVIQDEESKPTCCFGSCYDGELRGLPFPQNAKVTVTYRTGTGQNRRSYHDPVLFIPVLDHPLSSNRYYVIKRRGKHSGEASVSAKEEDRVPCCFCFTYVPEAKPQKADPYDIYQQFEIHQTKPSSRRYYATTVAPGGIPPEFLKRKYWTIGYSNSQDFGLTDDAKGINTKLRSELPNDLNTSVVVGKWYVPFIFVKERDAKYQIKSSTYYIMTLKQRWEEVYSCENVNQNDEEGEVAVDVEVETEVVKLEGEETNLRETSGDGVVWFSVLRDERQDKKVGLGSVVVERMKWEEEKFGWSNNGERSNIKRSERFKGGSSHWKNYKCYVLVESFELKRMDGSLVLTYEFRHVDKLKSKWD
ncbi:unnamed protein product [Thlaspi arvense]|uniref:Uncharacterized protein n=1 Tax=Thlaspi arvense TaxID=13288 RepID=A0AAU9RBG0_THLAR|nr:unnamed protein product [Thlaspi arvense]